MPAQPKTNRSPRAPLAGSVPGTYARKAGVPAVDNRRLTIVFENGVLTRIEGADAMPPRDPVKPESRDRTLNATPL